MYASKLINPIIQDPLIDIGGLKRNVSLDLVSLNYNFRSPFLWAGSMSFSQFLVIDSKKSSVSFLGRIMFKFIDLLYFN